MNYRSQRYSKVKFSTEQYGTVQNKAWRKKSINTTEIYDMQTIIYKLYEVTLRKLILRKLCTYIVKPIIERQTF